MFSVICDALRLANSSICPSAAQVGSALAKQARNRVHREDSDRIPEEGAVTAAGDGDGVWNGVRNPLADEAAHGALELMMDPRCIMVTL